MDISLAEIAALVSIIGTIWLILFGKRTLLDLFQRIKDRLRGRKRLGKPPRPHVPFLADTKEAIERRAEYREFLLKRTKSLLDQTKDDNIRESLLRILKYKSLDEASIPIASKDYFIDCICASVTRGGRTTILLPSGESEPNIEGVGRTAVLLNLLGLKFPYGRLIGLGLDDIRSLTAIPLDIRSVPWCYLLTSDMAWLGFSGNRLGMIPTNGEPMSSLWDLARHLYRTTELEYKTGDHRSEPGRLKLIEIFDRIPVESLFSRFGRIDQLYPVDEVIIIRRNYGAPSMPVRRELTGQERLEQLRKSLRTPQRHGSPFWHRSQQKVDEYVDYITSSLDLDKISSISEISYSYPELVIPNYIFDGIAELIKNGKQRIQPEIPEKKNIVVGIGYHNYHVTRGLQDADEVRLLVTSGEKIFEDTSFWKALSQVRREIILKILMLNPDSPLVEKREKEAYPDKPLGFLKEEIHENVETIKRMSNYFMKKPIKIKLLIWDDRDMPPFRMTFIGKDRLLVTSYEPEKRTGSETIFRDITPQEMGELLEGFNREYDRIEKLAKPTY